MFTIFLSEHSFLYMLLFNQLCKHARNVSQKMSISIYSIIIIIVFVMNHDWIHRNKSLTKINSFHLVNLDMLFFTEN